jgi:hypothetical protein
VRGAAFSGFFTVRDYSKTAPNGVQAASGSGLGAREWTRQVLGHVQLHDRLVDYLCQVILGHDSDGCTGQYCDGRRIVGASGRALCPVGFDGRYPCLM